MRRATYPSNPYSLSVSPVGESVLLLFASGSLVAFPKVSVGPAVFDDFEIFPALLVMSGSVGDSVGKGSFVGGVPEKP